MTENKFKQILSKYCPGIKFYRSPDGRKLWVYPWTTSEYKTEKWGLEEVIYWHLPYNYYVQLVKTTSNPYPLKNKNGLSEYYPYRFPNDDELFEQWVKEQAELHRPFYCGGSYILDHAEACINP